MLIRSDPSFHKKNFVNALVHKYSKNYRHQKANDKGEWVFDLESARKEAEEFVNNNWERGRIPMVKKTALETSLFIDPKQKLDNVKRENDSLFNIYDDEFMTGKTENNLELYNSLINFTNELICQRQ